MQYRKFGNTEMEVSEVAFGAWAIGGGAMIGETSIGWGDADDVVSRQAIHAALDAGINFFDTADIYGLGHSERIIGETIGHDSTIMIATKVGNVARENKFTVDYSKKYILSACTESLKRLRRNQIDYYQLHSARLTHLQNGECIEAMQQLQHEGKIRYWGLSLNTFDPFPEADYLIESNNGSGFQLVLNILNQAALPLISKASDKGYGIIARMPLQFGLLTGKFDDSTHFPVNDHRHNRLTVDVISAANSALEPVWELCNKYNITKTQLALSYVLSYTQVSTTIPGIRTPGHVAQNTTGLVTLSTQEIQMIEELGKDVFDPVMQLIQKKG